MNAPALIELSDERDQWERMCAAAYREGWQAARCAHQDDYAIGYVDGLLRLKRLEHQAVDEARIELARWGPGGREHFGDPQAGDFTGGPEAVERVRQAWLSAGFSLGPGPGWVHLGGRFAHGNPGGHRPCTPACYAYEPGWHRIADAIAILETLPGGYAGAIAELRRELVTAAA
jgi:hypothetical protein